jgi:hypothetical protein
MKTKIDVTKMIDLSGLTPGILPGLAARLGRDWYLLSESELFENAIGIGVELNSPGSPDNPVGLLIVHLENDPEMAWMTVQLNAPCWWYSFDVPEVDLARVPLFLGRVETSDPDHFAVSAKLTPAFEALYRAALRGLADAIADELANPTPVPPKPEPEVTMPTPEQISLYFKAQSAKAAAKLKGTREARERARKAGRAKKRKRRSGVRPANALVKGSEEARNWAERMRAAQAARAEARRAL